MAFSHIFQFFLGIYKYFSEYCKFLEIYKELLGFIGNGTLVCIEFKKKITTCLQKLI